MNNILQKVSDREIRSGFTSKNLEILDFYGNLSLFHWKEHQLAIFSHYPHSTTDDEVQIIDTGPLKPTKLITPKPIKTICSYSGRVFIICEPTGIYKLSNKFTFALLSNTGIGLGCEFHQVLTPTRDWLYLADKFTKKTEPLFQLYQDINYKIINNTINYDLQQILINNENSKKSCLITSGRKLYKLTGEIIEILHIEIDSIIDLISIKKGKKDFGVGLITQGHYLVILLPDKDNTEDLVPLKKVYYDGNIVSLTIYSSPRISDKLWSFHTNGDNIYHRSINTDSSVVGRNENINVIFTADNDMINCLKTFNDTILMITSGNKLMEFSIMDGIMGQNGDKREFNVLRDDMIRNTNIIVNRICERSRELEGINKKIIVGQKKLERINIYAHKQKTIYSPVVKIVRVSGRDYLEIKLEGLPLEARVFVNVRIDRRRIFSSKIVKERITSLEIPLEIRNVEEVGMFDVRIDVVVSEGDGQVWCILNNFGGQGVVGSVGDREILLSAKLDSLRGLMEMKGIDWVKLGCIKKSIRKDGV